MIYLDPSDLGPLILMRIISKEPTLNNLHDGHERSANIELVNLLTSKYGNQKLILTVLTYL